LRYCDSPIGIFDSGVGGLSVLSELDIVLPDEHYIYFGDTKNLPYGTKTKDEIIVFTKDIMNFFVSRGVKNVVVACNTSSALSYEELAKEYKNSLTIYPLIQTVAKDIAKYSKIGVMATKSTVNSLTYTKEILKKNKTANVFEAECSGFVEIVEQGLLKKPSAAELVKSKLETLLSQDVEKIVLGCTHYPHLMPVLEKYAPKDTFIDPAHYLCKFVKSEFEKNTPVNAPAKKEFFVSGNSKQFMKSAKLFYNVKEVQSVELSAFRNNSYTAV